MNRFATTLLSLFALAGVSCAYAVEIADVTVADKLKQSAAGPELILNGAGLRTLYMVKIYVAGLYLTEKRGNAADVIALKGPKRIQMSLIRGVSVEQLLDALHDGLKANLSAAELAQFAGQIEQLNTTFSALKKTRKGDVVALDLVPGAGTRVSVNGESTSAPIAGDEFYGALLKIWLGDKPVQDKLKEALLGQR